MEQISKRNPLVSRRDFAAGAGALSIAIGLGGHANATSSEFVSTVFGGVWESEYRKNIVDPFEKETNTNVLLKLGVSSEWLTNAVVNQQAPEIDLLLLPYPDNIRACDQGLGMPLTADDIPNIKHVDPIWYNQFGKTGIGLDYVGYGIAYREDLVPVAPKSWADLWNPAYQGKIMIPQIGQWGSWEMLVVAARLNGGNEDNMAPGIAALHRLRPNIKQFFKSSADISNMLGSGEVWICGMATNVAPYALIDAGKPVKFIFPTEGAMVGAAAYVIAKHSTRADLCKKFIDFALSKTIQENFCNGVIAAPTNMEAVVNQKTRERVPPREKLQLFDWAKIIPQMAALTDQWNQQVAF